MVSGAVVLFFGNPQDTCNETTRCDLAASAGAIGCLIANGRDPTGTSFPLFGFRVNLIFQEHLPFPLDILLISRMLLTSSKQRKEILLLFLRSLVWSRLL